MTIEIELKSLAQYPEILGIKYNSQDFSWKQGRTTKWSWMVNSAALQELQTVGGTIQRFDAQNISSASRELLTKEFQAGSDDQFMVDYASKAWQGLEINIQTQI